MSFSYKPPLKPTGFAIGMGTCFFVMFWLALDNFALGLALGVALGSAFYKSDNQQKDDPADSQDSSKGKHE